LAGRVRYPNHLCNNSGKILSFLHGMKWQLLVERGHPQYVGVLLISAEVLALKLTAKIHLKGFAVLEHSN
jgi:hypothetical protein